MLLYWFPPWRLGVSSHGTPNHNLITESFLFIGFVKKRKDATHLSGVSLYKFVSRTLIALYILTGLLRQEDINDVYLGIGEFGLFGLIVWGVFYKEAEDSMNEQVRDFLNFENTE